MFFSVFLLTKRPQHRRRFTPILKSTSLRIYLKLMIYNTINYIYYIREEKNQLTRNAQPLAFPSLNCGRSRVPPRTPPRLRPATDLFVSPSLRSWSRRPPARTERRWVVRGLGRPAFLQSWLFLCGLASFLSTMGVCGAELRVRSFFFHHCVT